MFVGERSHNNFSYFQSYTSCTQKVRIFCIGHILPWNLTKSPDFLLGPMNKTYHLSSLILKIVKKSGFYVKNNSKTSKLQKNSVQFFDQECDFGPFLTYVSDLWLIFRKKYGFLQRVFGCLCTQKVRISCKVVMRTLPPTYQ